MASNLRLTLRTDGQGADPWMHNFNRGIVPELPSPASIKEAVALLMKERSFNRELGKILDHAFGQDNVKVLQASSAEIQSDRISGGLLDSHSLIEMKDDGPEIINSHLFDKDYFRTSPRNHRILLRKSYPETIVHEVAHAYLVDYLDQNFQQLCKSGAFPAWSISFNQEYQRYFLNEVMYEYLAERFAYHFEYVYLSTQAEKKGPFVYGTFGLMTGEYDEAHIWESTKFWIFQNYQVASDPRLAPLHGRQLSEIFPSLF